MNDRAGTLPGVSTYVVFAAGADRPGIAAAVTGALFERGANLADCSMTILAGQFAMVLLVEMSADRVDETADDVALEEALAAPAAAFDLVTAVRAVEPGHRDPGGVPHVVSVYGADRPGIVHHVCTALAALGVNVTDLSTRVLDGDGGPVYAMLLDVSVPAGIDTGTVAADLAVLAAEMDVEATIHAADADVL